MGLSSSEDRMIVAGVVLAWYLTVTDGQTDDPYNYELYRFKVCAFFSETQCRVVKQMRCSVKCTISERGEKQGRSQPWAWGGSPKL